MEALHILLKKIGMMKYVCSEVVFQELPDEITLAINISGCPIRCPDCHSKYLWEDVGEVLTTEVLESLINKNPGITAICFMGGDSDTNEIINLAKYVKLNNLAVGWYSGKQTVPNEVLNNLRYFDYIKVGPYIKEKGPINNKNTNQILFEVCLVNKLNNKYLLKNITYKFWKNHENTSKTI